ncbi:centromere subunit L [Xylariales sp. PMI_506]|nr:centromere subunit L [Xylariales sp. PMI_506]
MRMPAPFKAVIADFLARTFDCRVSPLRLGTRTLVASWEGWFETAARKLRLSKDAALVLGFHLEKEPGTGAAPGAVSSTPAPGGWKGAAAEDGADEQGATTAPLGLKTLDVVISAEDVFRFLRAGHDITSRRIAAAAAAAGAGAKKKRRRGGGDSDDESQQTSAPSAALSPSRRRHLAGGKDDEGWAWRFPGSVDTSATTSPTTSGSQQQQQPFVEALAAYLGHHLALDLFHPGVRVLRVACDGFVLAEGRVKLFAAPASLSRGDVDIEDEGDDDGGGGNAATTAFMVATWSLVDALVQRAQGPSLGGGLLLD